MPSGFRKSRQTSSQGLRSLSRPERVATLSVAYYLVPKRGNACFQHSTQLSASPSNAKDKPFNPMKTKKNSPSQISKPSVVTIRWRSVLGWRCAGCVFISALLLGGLAAWSKAQSLQRNPSDSVTQRFGEPDEAPQDREKREFDRLSILDPEGFEAAVRPLKTQREISDEEIAIFAIMQPEACAREFERFKDGARKNLEAATRQIILTPSSVPGKKSGQPASREP